MNPKAPFARCDDCPLKDRPFVPGHGPRRTDRVIVGEAPGETEVRKGKPFVGRAGAVLNEELGIDRSSVYITNAVLCRPERNKKPSARAVRACHDRLIREIKQRGPKKVLALGETAAGAVTGESRKIAELRLAGPLRSPFLGDDVAVRVTYHPAAVLRNSNLRPLFASDIRFLTSVAERLRRLGVRGVLVQMAERDQILELECEMPTCYCPKGRRHFKPRPRTTPFPDWAPNADHYPTLRMDGGHLDPWNVRLAHVRCNNEDYAWRGRIRRMLEKNKTMSFEQIAQALNKKKRVQPPPGESTWSAGTVRKAYVS